MVVDHLPEEKAILERIRERLRSLPPGLIPPLSSRPPPPEDASPDAAAIDLETMRRTKDVYDQPFRSQIRPLASAFALANRMARKLLKPSLERQVSYNAATERLVRALIREMEGLQRSQAALVQRCESLQAEIAAVRDAKRGG